LPASTGWRSPTPADLADAKAVCRDLGLGGLLDEMPAGLAQPLGETGWQLSHGEQALRSAPACVLARAPTLLVIAHE